jgi:integrase
MTGHVRRRGDRSWEIKFDLGTDPLTGKRLTRYHSFKGTKREAEAELTRLKAGADAGTYVDPSKTTLSEFIDRWLSDWAPANVTPKTLERYKQLTSLHVKPHLGASRLQKVKALHFAELYGKLQRAKADGGAGLHPRTVGHVHRLAHRILSHALKWGLLVSNPVSSADPPPVERTEIEIMTPDQVNAVLPALRGRTIYPIAVLGLATGMRRGELLALRWGDVDFDAGKVRVERSLEQTKAGLRFKSPKTKSGRRNVSLPASVVTELRAHWRRQQEGRLALGIGKASGEDLVFTRADGATIIPDALSKEWARLVRSLKLPDVTLHAWRHTHASQLIAAGLDIVTVSRRLGHGNPSITLTVYAHLFSNTDARAAEIIEAAFAGALAE